MLHEDLLIVRMNVIWMYTEIISISCHLPVWCFGKNGVSLSLSFHRSWPIWNHLWCYVKIILILYCGGSLCKVCCVRYDRSTDLWLPLCQCTVWHAGPHQLFPSHHLPVCVQAFQCDLPSGVWRQQPLPPLFSFPLPTDWNRERERDKPRYWACLWKAWLWQWISVDTAQRGLHDVSCWELGLCGGLARMKRPKGGGGWAECLTVGPCLWNVGLEQPRSHTSHFPLDWARLTSFCVSSLLCHTLWERTIT